MTVHCIFPSYCICRADDESVCICSLLYFRADDDSAHLSFLYEELMMKVYAFVLYCILKLMITSVLLYAELIMTVSCDGLSMFRANDENLVQVSCLVYS